MFTFRKTYFTNKYSFFLGTQQNIYNFPYLCQHLHLEEVKTAIVFTDRLYFKYL